MYKYLILFTLIFTGCNKTTNLPLYVNGNKAKTAVCKLNNFVGFPKYIKGLVSIELKRTITLSIANRTKTSYIFISIDKRNCKEVKNNAK